MTAGCWPIAEIRIGKRHRRDLGDIDSLAQSIKEIGLLHPVVVRPDGCLIAGERRVAAFKKLDRTKIPATVINLGEIVKGEFAENAHRKNLLPTEINAIRCALEPLERAAAKKRMSEGGAGKKEGKVSTPSGKTRDKIGAVAGVSGRTVEKIAAVMDAAKANPEQFGDLPAKMDATGRVDAAYAKVSRRKKHQKITAEAGYTLAEKGPFPLLYADPPWKWGHFGEQDQENEEGKGRTPDQHYPTMTHDEILDHCVEGIPVVELAHKDAALFLWCTSSNIPRALEVMERWGFEFKSSAAWLKTKDGKLQTGMGLVFRNAHEILLYGTRGNMPGPQYQPPSVFLCPRGKHSAKPPEVREAIERMYPDFDDKSRLELFAREKVAGWTCWGNEIPRGQMSAGAAS